MAQPPVVVAVIAIEVDSDTGEAAPECIPAN
jgi:hypothetical protein